MHSRSIALLPLIFSLTLLGCAPPTTPNIRPVILTTFYPLQFISERIAGPQMEVTNITPTSVDPHNLELSPNQVRRMREADLIVYLSGGFQPAIEEALENISSVPHLDTVELTDGRPGDPHFWLDPLLLAQAGELIAEEFAEVDPEHGTLYVGRAKTLTQELEVLDSDFSIALEPCYGETLVTSHEAFGYLAQRYGLSQVGINGIDPEQEASPARLREVSKVVAGKNVRTLFFEAAASDKLVQVLATDLDVRVGVLNPMELFPFEGADYFQTMHTNLQALRVGLDCQ